MASVLTSDVFYYIYLFLCKGVHICHDKEVAVIGQLSGVRALFWHLNPGHQTQIIRLGAYWLSHLADLHIDFRFS